MRGFRTPVAALAAIWLLLPAYAAAAGAPKIVVDPLAFDYGQVDETEVVERTFTIRNLGDADLLITKVESTCGCTTTQLGGQTVPPGGSTELKAKINLRGRRGLQQKTVSVSSNDPAQPLVNLKLSGTVTAEVEVSPPRLDFLDVKEDQPGEKKVILSARQGSNVTITGLEPGGTFFTAQTTVLEEGRSYAITVRTVPPFKPGVTRAVLTVKTDHPKYPSILVPVTVQVASDLVTVPGVIAVPLDGTAAANHLIAVRSRAGKPFKILEVIPPFPGPQVEVKPDTPSSYKIELRNLAAVPKLAGTWLRILTDSPGAKELRIPFQVYNRPATPSARPAPAPPKAN